MNIWKSAFIIALISCVALCFSMVLACGDDDDDADDDDDDDDDVTSGSDFAITSPAVVDGELLADFQCEEKVENIEDSISLAWSGLSCDLPRPEWHISKIKTLRRERSFSNQVFIFVSGSAES